MSDADMKNEDGPAGTQEAMLNLNDHSAPEPGGSMFWDPVSKQFVERGNQDDQPFQHQVPGTPSPMDIDFQEKTKNPQFEGVFASATANGYRMQAEWFYQQAEQAGNPAVQRHNKAKGDYYMQLAKQYDGTDPALNQAINGAPDSIDATDVYQDRSDKPTINNTDNSFPSMLSHETPEVTGTMLNNGQNFGERHSDRQAPNLRDCPEDLCGGKMTDMGDDSICHDCGHKEKVHYAGFAAPLMVGAELLEGAGAAGAAAEGAGAAAGAAEGAGAAADAAGSGMGTANVLRAGNLMARVMNRGGGGGGGAQMPDAGAGSSVADQDMQSTASSVEDGDWGTNGFENSGHDSEPDAGNKGSEGQDTAADELDSDVDTGTGGQDGKNVLEIFELARPHLESIADNDDSDQDPIAQIIHDLLEGSFPGYLEKAARYSFIVEAVDATCPTCHIDISRPDTPCGGPPNVQCPVGLRGNANIMQVMPGQATNPASMGQPTSKVADGEGFEITSARRPKMCPVHEQLVNYALLLQDPGAALAAFSGTMFGEHSCQGGYEMINKAGNPTKCRFKPEMVTQTFWDEKDALAEQRRLEREQMQALQPEQPMLPPQPLDPIPEPTPEVPEGTLVGGPEFDAQQEQQVVEEKAPITQDIPSTEPLQAEQDYIPREQGEADTFPAEWAQEPQVVARIKWSGPPAGLDLGVAPTAGPEEMFADSPPEELPEDSGVSSDLPLDSEGNPLEVGMEYEVESPMNEDYIPDVYKITAVTPDLIQFEVKSNVEGGEPFSFTDSLPVAQIKADGLRFNLASDSPNARGDVAPDTDDDNTKGSDVPGEVTDLDTGGNSKAAGRFDKQIPGQTGLANEFDELGRQKDRKDWQGIQDFQDELTMDNYGGEEHARVPVDLGALATMREALEATGKLDAGQIEALLNEAVREMQNAQNRQTMENPTGEEYGLDEDDMEGMHDPMQFEDEAIDTARAAAVLQGHPEFDWLNEDDGVKTAGRDFSLGEQRGFVNEIGTARNLSKLDLSGTHYPDVENRSGPADLSDYFLWG